MYRNADNNNQKIIGISKRDPCCNWKSYLELPLPDVLSLNCIFPRGFTDRRFLRIIQNFKLQFITERYFRRHDVWQAENGEKRPTNINNKLQLFTNRRQWSEASALLYLKIRIVITDTHVTLVHNVAYLFTITTHGSYFGFFLLWSNPLNTWVLISGGGGV